MSNQNPERYPDTFLQGVILGLLIGCVLVLWFSPQNGKELLDSLKKRLPPPGGG